MKKQLLKTLNAYKVKEIRCHIVRETAVEPAVIRTPENIAEAWGLLVETAAWFQEDKELFVVFLLDSQHHIKALNLVAMGLLDACAIHPREVFRPAIAYASAAIVLAHNHPSGDPTPSSEDILVTQKLVEAGNIVDICIMDHVIIGNTGHVSLRESGTVKFS
jgi:DNA repair protein RadC